MFIRIGFVPKGILISWPRKPLLLSDTGISQRVQISSWTIPRKYIFRELSLSAALQELVFSLSQKSVKRARGFARIILKRHQLYFWGNECFTAWNTTQRRMQCCLHGIVCMDIPYKWKKTEKCEINKQKASCR